MAFTPLAVTTTLGSFKTQVRAATGAIDPQTSGLLDLTLNDLVHQAVVLVRSIGATALDEFYWTRWTSGVETSLVIPVSTLDFSSARQIVVYDSVDGDITIIPSDRFYALQGLYSATDLADAIFAHIRTNTDGAISVELFRGTSKTDQASTLTIMFPRTPTKATLETAKIDLPEAYIPAALDVAEVMTFRLLGKVPPTDLERRVKDFISMKISEATPKGGR
jgi:hypothetical protein